MSTLADIRKASDVAVRTYTDDRTPPNHFLATAQVLGIVTDYLLRGDQVAEDAPIVGRIEWGSSPAVACGSGIKGGQPIFSGFDDSASAFRMIVARSAATQPPAAR